MNKYDLAKLEALAVGAVAETKILSPETIDLCLMALTDRAQFAGAWVDDDGQITAARWDQAAALVDRARLELMSSVTIDGGTP